MRLTVSLLFVLLICFTATAEERPNIIYINVDDLGWADLSCQGSQYYRTPNIDKLAGGGMTFTNAYAAAANCAPSRACALTGQNTPRHGVYTVLSSARGKSEDRKIIPVENTLHIKEENLTIAGALKRVGYVTATIGKWHVTKDPLKNGFDINIAGTQAGGPYTGGYHSPYRYPNLVEKKKGRYLTDHLTDEAIKFIEKYRDEKFFLYFPFYTVHTPIQGKKDKIKKYQKLTPTKGQNSPAYAAMIESLDENVGRLMNKLEALGLAENTIVLFTSDNGGVWKISKQWPLRAGKGSYYEGGIREPFFVRWPGKIKAGSKTDVPVTALDIFPTFLAATKTEVPEDKVLDGDNILPLLKGESGLKDRPLFWHFPIYLQAGGPESSDVKFRTRPGSVVRYGDWKLHEYFEDGRFELYNLKDDLAEKKNLVQSHPEKVQELAMLLKNWRQTMGAPVPTEKNPEYKGE